jgi:curved DNA-binding protein CbpA
MNYEKACKVLEIHENMIIDSCEIKRQYKIMALTHHPDKNPSPDASSKFQEIHDAYEYLMTHNNEDMYDSDEDKTTIDKGSYRWVLFSFIKNVLNTETGNHLFCTVLERISKMCEKNALETLEKIDNNMLIKIHELLKKYKGAFHFTESFCEKIEDLIKTKIQKDEYVILNPILDDLFENNLYKLTVNNMIYIVPLWHHELVYDNSGCDVYVKCNPMLPENIDIDDSNNIHVKKTYTIDELWEKDTVDLHIGRKTLTFYPNLLKIKKTQTIVLRGQGISKINTTDIYDVTKRSDVFLHLDITLK